MRWDKVLVLAGKEVRELIRERLVLFGMILGPIIIFAFLGGIMGAAVERAAEEARPPERVGVYWLGEGRPPQDVLEALTWAFGAVSIVDRPGEMDVTIILDPGIVEALRRGDPVEVPVVVVSSGLSLTFLGKIDAIDGILDRAYYRYLADRCSACGVSLDPDRLGDPVGVEVQVLYRGKLMSMEEAMAYATAVGFGVPFAVMILALATITVSALSVGAEKEAKTLETLLTLPLSRSELIMGKALGVVALSLLGIASYAGGLYIYTRMTAAAVAGGGELGVGTSMTLGQGILILAGLALAVVTASLIGFAAGSLAQDLRGAQMLASYLGLLLIAPSFIVMFGFDPSSFSPAVRAALLLDPFMVLVYQVYEALVGSITASLQYLLGLVAHVILWSLVAARMIASESLITGSSRIQRLIRRPTTG